MKSEYSGSHMRSSALGDPVGGLYDHLDIAVQILEDGASASVRVDERHCNMDGVVHGGILATILDTALGFAARAARDDESDNRTLDMQVSFFQAAQVGQKLEARAHVEQLTKRLAWATASVSVVADDSTEHVIASGRSLNYAVGRSPPDSTR